MAIKLTPLEARVYRHLMDDFWIGYSELCDAEDITEATARETLKSLKAKGRAKTDYCINNEDKLVGTGWYAVSDF